MQTSVSSRKILRMTNLNGLVVNGTLHCLVESTGNGCACNECSLNKECFDERSVCSLCVVFKDSGSFYFRKVGELMPVKMLDTSKISMQ